MLLIKYILQVPKLATADLLLLVKAPVMYHCLKTIVSHTFPACYVPPDLSFSADEVDLTMDIPKSCISPLVSPWTLPSHLVVTLWSLHPQSPPLSHKPFKSSAQFKPLGC